ncbi:MAG: polysaccharide biosynthesis/export family protein [Limisphaerales bacterium]
MKKNSLAEIIGGKGGIFHQLGALLSLLALLALIAGCQTNEFTTPPPPQGTNVINVPAVTNVTKIPDVITLRESDVLKILFPANPNLNTTQPIRRDGMISMPLIGEVKAAGKTPAQLEADLVDLYSTQLLSKEVTVEVQSSTFPVYVTGSVLRAGRVVADHPMTAFEAIMEAGGFDYEKANMKAVVVIRQEGDHVQKFKLDLKKVMDGKAGAPFYLHPGDTIFVPEKFTWF